MTNKSSPRSVRLPPELDEKLVARCSDISISDFLQNAVALALAGKISDRPVPGEMRSYAGRILALLGSSGLSETVSRLKDAGRNGALSLTPEEHESLLTLGVVVPAIKALLLEMNGVRDFDPK